MCLLRGYKLGFYIPEDGILHSHRRGNLKSYNLYLCHIYLCWSRDLVLLESWKICRMFQQLRFSG
jgi:hypothetical protein